MSTAPIEGDAGPEAEAIGLADEIVTITRAELEDLRSLALAATRSSREAGERGASAEAARVEEAMARELAARDRKVADLESSYRRAVRDRELATALAGKPLTSGAAGQLIKLWRDDFDVYEESGELKVAARDGRPVAQWVADRLAHADYAHFCLPSSRGGAGSKGLSQSGSSAPSVPSAPSARTLGEAVIAQWRDSAADRVAPAAGPAGWGRRG